VDSSINKEWKIRIDERGKIIKPRGTGGAYLEVFFQPDEYFQA
jgi:hypothetical protein